MRAFIAISAARMGVAHEQKRERVGMPIAGDDARAIELAWRLIREIGYEPVLIGGRRWRASARRIRFGRSPPRSSSTSALPAPGGRPDLPAP